MTPRDQDFLDDALAAFDLLHFDGHLSDRGVTIKWHRFRTKGTSTRFAEVALGEHPQIRVNRVLAQQWVPSFFLLDVIHHELIHVLLGPAHDLAFRLCEDRYVHHAKASMWEVANIEAFMEASKALTRTRKRVT